MKKLIIAMLALAAIAPLSAQQLPNNGFEEDWVQFTPWKTGTTKTSKNCVTPPGWTVADVASPVELIVAEKLSEGYNNTSSVKLINKSTVGQNIPGYMTLGTTWSTSSMGFLSIKNKDGGSFGGYEFAYTPDAVAFVYKAENNPASVVVYMWKGTYKQNNVPGEVVLSGTPKATTMIDRDRQILKEAYPEVWTSSLQGDTPTEFGTLIAYNKVRPAVVSDWAEYTLPLTYKSTDAPEKINVIFSAGDYFTQPTKSDLNNTISVDDVKLLYYSRLKTLSVNDTKITLADGTYEYDLSKSVYMPKSEQELSYTLLGESPAKTVSVALDAENNTATITVKNTNEGATDVDGKAEHVYTIKFKAPDYSRLKTLSVNGTEVPLTDGIYAYDLSESVYMPKNVDAFSYTVMGESSAVTVDIALNAENNTATITVKNTNEGAQDVDGKAEHVYIIKFKAPDYSRLKTLSVSGTEVQLEDGVYEYDLSASVYMPKNADAFSYTVMGESSAVTVDIALNAENNTATITVKNNEGAQDIDGKAEHGYTIKFKAPRVFTGIEYPGHITTLTWNVDGSGHTPLIEEPVKASVWMTKKGMKRIVDVLLPDFTLPGFGNIGDILVEDVTRTYNNNNGNPIYDYTGHVDDLSLADGGIHAVVDLEGTSDVEGNVNFKIHVKWDPNATQSMVAREAAELAYIPIEVEFNGKTNTPEVPTGINDVSVDGADAPVEYFDLQGIRVSNPQAGRMVIRRQGTNVEKILVK